MSIQLQWSLDSTVRTTLSVARDLFLAANNDNVQPLAIASCEKFGNTIAMCQDTCRKIEMLTAKSPEPVAINFIRAYVGFDDVDCAAQLSKSQAGIQFLGLAAALVTSLGAFEGGNSLHEMITSSASDKTLLPTARQLKDLLQSLEPRLVQSGYLNAVVGWHVFLCQSPMITQEYREFLQVAKLCPDFKGIDSLADAFRQLSRVGEADITKISIRVTSCATWVIAFTKWCLGLPPSIYLGDGTVVLEQPGSKVDLTIIRDSKANQGIQISIHHAVGTPSDLVEARLGLEWTGMINVEEFGRWRLYDFNLDTGIAKNALLQALPFTIKQVIQHLRFSNYRKYDDSSLEPHWSPVIVEKGPQLDEDLIALGLVPFPEEHIIAQTMSHYLACSDMVTLDSLEGFQIDDLPAVKLYLTTSKRMCSCNKCGSTHFQSYRPCKVDTFFVHLATICADILALSLFEGVDLPLLHLRRSLGSSALFVKAIESVISNGAFRCKNFHLLDYALELAGHYSPSTPDHWIMSSCKGQVIYPKLYETLCYERKGYLTLNWIPGLLRYNGETYNRVMSGHRAESTGRFTVVSNMPVKAPCYLMPQGRLIWRVEQCENHLRVALGLEGDIDYRETALPGMIFEKLASALLLEACAHEHDAVLESPDTFCAFTSPTLPKFRDSERAGVQTIGVVAVDGCNEMRFYSLASDGPFVLRKKACLSCCLSVCKRANYPVLVL